jgi:hypothetical protein
MMGRLNHDQGELFYSFCLEEVVPDDHPIRVHASSNGSEPPQVGQARRAAASAARANCGVRVRSHAKVALTVLSVASQSHRSNGASGSLRLSSAQGATGFSLL